MYMSKAWRQFMFEGNGDRGIGKTKKDFWPAPIICIICDDWIDMSGKLLYLQTNGDTFIAAMFVNVKSKAAPLNTTWRRLGLWWYSCAVLDLGGRWSWVVSFTFLLALMPVAGRYGEEKTPMQQGVLFRNVSMTFRPRRMRWARFVAYTENL
jgi:hypothetical protein